MSRLRLLRFSTRAEQVTVHEDGRVQSQDETLSPAEEGRTNAAANIVEEARQRGDELLRASAERSTEVEHAAYERGHERGYADGAAAARAEVAEALAFVQQIAREGKALRDRLLQGAEREAVELVIASVESILGEQVRLEPSLVLDTVERALKRAGAQNIIRVRVNPDDRELVNAHLDQADGDTGDGWQVTADGAIGVGGCVIDTESGQVDARLDVQLEEIARAFRSADPDLRAREVRSDAA